MKTRKYENDQIRELLEKNLPQAPQNEWFIKKAINRLPEKKQSTISIIEYIGYIFALLIVIFYDCVIGYNIALSELITINDIIWILSLNTLLFAIMFAILHSYLKNEFN